MPAATPLGSSAGGQVLTSVLCVEDNEAIQRMLRLALAEIGRLEVQTCMSGEEALRIVSQQTPELILLDWDLPGLSGAETLAAIRQLTCANQALIVIMTARNDGETIPAGVLCRLVKPLDPMHLAGKLRRLHADARAISTFHQAAAY